MSNVDSAQGSPYNAQLRADLMFHLNALISQPMKEIGLNGPLVAQVQGILADQAGDATYNAASQVTQNVAITGVKTFNGITVPPSGPGWSDRWGPGTRIPALVISPFARRGFVDKTVYDTTSVLKLITRRFGLEPLPGVREKAGDLTQALQ